MEVETWQAPWDLTTQGCGGPSESKVTRGREGQEEVDQHVDKSFEEGGEGDEREGGSEGLCTQMKVIALHRLHSFIHSTSIYWCSLRTTAILGAGDTLLNRWASPCHHGT